MKIGDRLNEAQVRRRILDALDSIFDDGEDAASVHNMVAQGGIEYDPAEGDWVCTQEADEVDDDDDVDDMTDILGV